MSLGYDGAGKRIRRTVYAETKQETLDKIAELRAKAGAGLNGNGGKMTLREFLLHWLENVIRSKARPTTFDRYKTLAEKHVIPVLGGVKLEQLTSAC